MGLEDLKGRVERRVGDTWVFFAGEVGTNQLIIPIYAKFGNQKFLFILLYTPILLLL